MPPRRIDRKNVEEATRKTCLLVQKNRIKTMAEARDLFEIAMQEFMQTNRARQFSERITGFLSRADNPEILAFFEK